MMLRWGTLLVIGAVAVSGCAIPTTALVDGQLMKRPTLQYTDARFFKLTHQGVHPGASPSTGTWADGGRITGMVCGSDIVYDVWHAGTIDYITGFLRKSATDTATDLPVKLVIEDSPEGRSIHGVVGRGRVDLQLTPEHVEGAIVTRFFAHKFSLKAEGDDLVGSADFSPLDRAQMRVYGRSALWSMPASTQAALLPAMLTCQTLQQGGRDIGVPIGVIDLRHRVSFTEPDVPGAVTSAQSPPPEPPQVVQREEAPQSPEAQAAFAEYERLRIGVVYTGGQSGVAGTGGRLSRQAAFYQGRNRRFLADTYELLKVAGEPGEAERYRDRRRLRYGLVIGGAALAVGGAVLTGLGFAGVSDAQARCTARYPSTGGCIDRFEAVEAGTKAQLGLGVGLIASAAVGIIVAGFIPGSHYTLDDHVAVADRYNARLRQRLGVAGIVPRPTNLVVAPILSPDSAGLQLAFRF